MSETLESQMKTFVSRVSGLIRRGHQVRDTLARDSSDPSAIVAARAWQEECGVAIHQLSGGSKAHWLARAFSDAFLLRSANGSAVEEAAPQAIIQRLLDVLAQAVTVLSREDSDAVVIARENVAPRRFEFVHNSELRQVLERAYVEGRLALEQGEYDLAMRTYCGILETIVTDGLEHRGLSELATTGAPAGEIPDWSFDARLAAAEKAGLIRGGCARLPAAARAYREHDDNASSSAISERDAKSTGQVLNVIMRDLDPGR